jgi:hypothetical protein
MNVTIKDNMTNDHSMTCPRVCLLSKSFETTGFKAVKEVLVLCIYFVRHL